MNRPLLFLLSFVIFGCTSTSETSEASTAALDLAAESCCDLSVAPASANAQLTDDPFLSNGKSWRVRLEREDPIKMREFFSIDVWVEPADQLGVPAEDVTVRVDARMPHHRHGMLGPCELSQVGPGHWRCSNMRLHMVGYWEFHVDIDDAGLVERAQTSIELE